MASSFMPHCVRGKGCWIWCNRLDGWMLLVNRKNDTAFEAHLDFLILDPPEGNLLIYAHLVTNFLLLCCLHYHLQTQSKLFRLMHHSISSCNNTYNLVQDHKNRVIHLKLIHQLCRNIESKLKNQPEAFILVWPSNQTLISQRSLVLKKLPMIGAVNYYYLLPLHCNLLHMNMFVVLNWLW